MRVFGSKALFLCVLFVGALLSGCTPQLGIVDPPEEAILLTEQDPRNEGKVARKSFWQEVQLVQPISFCYSGTLHKADAIIAEAQDICKGGTVALFSSEVELRACPLLQPNRVTFICSPDPNREE